MPRFAANLSMMFNEWDFMDRFAAAADAGFDAVEFLFPYEHAPDAIARRLADHGLTQALFNLPPGDWAAGERGLACLAGREAEFREGVRKAKAYVEATGVRRVHMMSGHGDAADPAARGRYVANLRHAADELGPLGAQVLLEPINGRDMPGYFMNSFALAESIVREVASPRVALQFDMYHRQILHGDVTMGLRAQFPMVAHVQIASVPSRNEPDGEEMNYPFLFAELDRLGYDGFVGCEYRPRAGTREGLGWFAPWRRR
ncbi:hydroxypyruvate isomerase family protein [Alsobacter sp. SYSU M60028]|uniref:Hydroxypyruvate isomerase family protein n=1 Tax=Alsobacter ponti TaxID=2962936 RepID=A0ABT1LHN9_9HYPH|nr:2-oxo-tetronate isomerase [Alsobacter ponti]MCP8940633.1 hydroxypyruvate isomerase family protein [Alsobacter ponti]